jgi:cleavage and polyadenylation specificity factor subunit 1
MDILSGLPKTKDGYQYILLLIDSFSHWCECVPLTSQDSVNVAKVLYNEIFTRFGMPVSPIITAF